MAYIYKIENIINNKIYIGYTSKTVQARLKQHIRHARKSNLLLSNNLNKYTLDDFTVSIIYENNDNKYTKEIIEPLLIRIFNSHYLDGHGYNMTYGGEGLLGYKMTERRKKILSEIGKNLPKEKHSCFGKPKSEETKAKMSLARIGKPAPWTEDKDKCSQIGRKISEAKKLNNPASEANTGNYKIIFSSGDTIFIRNLNKFAKENNHSSSTLYSIVRKDRVSQYKDIISITKID